MAKSLFKDGAKILACFSLAQSTKSLSKSTPRIFKGRPDSKAKWSRRLKVRSWKAEKNPSSQGQMAETKSGEDLSRIHDDAFRCSRNRSWTPDFNPISAKFSTIKIRAKKQPRPDPIKILSAKIYSNMQFEHLIASKWSHNFSRCK